MIRSLTIKFVLLAGTLGLVMALTWPVQDRGAAIHRIAEFPSASLPLAVAANSTVSEGPVEKKVTRLDSPKLVDSNNYRPKAGAIDLNLSTAQELESLPGVGPTLAKRIVDHRRQVGGFQSLQALDDVKGIGKKKLQAIRPFLKISPNIVVGKQQG